MACREPGAPRSGRSSTSGAGPGLDVWTPVHPVPTEQAFHIIVPLGAASEWARNVLAAGHCRLQLHDVVHELDEPALVEPAAVPGLPPIARRIGSWLGFRYLLLHRLSSSPGSLAGSAADANPARGVASATEEGLPVLTTSPS